MHSTSPIEKSRERGSRAFPTTEWSVVGAIKTENNERCKAAIDLVSQRYWRPVNYYLLRLGYGEHTANDLTQGFFCDIVLERKLAQPDPTKGRFRSLLLTALKNYVATVHRREHYATRQPKGGIQSLETSQLSALPATISYMEPDDVFHLVFVQDMLKGVLAELENEYRSAGKQQYWEVFNLRFLRPILEKKTAPSLSEVCVAHNVESASVASNMIVTVKRRFCRILKRELRQVVSTDEEVDEEYQEILAIFSKSRAR